MLPGQVLSSTPIIGPYLPPDDIPMVPLVDYELGGIALRDPTQGLRVQVWTLRMVGDDVVVSAPAVTDTVLFTRAGITQIGLAFDQNMNPAVAFETAEQMTLWWFDSVSSAQIFTDFDGEHPRICLDDKRHSQGGSSDIILAYLRANKLMFRAQRDRFGVEYELADIPPDTYTFDKMGMNTVNRIQFQFTPLPVEAP